MPAGKVRLLLLATVFLPWLASGASVCRDDLDEADGYTIRSVKIEGRWVPSIALPIKPGDRFSNAGVQQALEVVRQALDTQDRQSFELQNVGAVGVLHISRCLLVEDHQVDVIIQPRALRVDLFEVGGNVLPVPRAPFATFYQAVPAPILRFHPLLGAYQDKEYGFASTGAIDTQLLDFPRSASGATSQFRLAADGRKSFEHSFYNANAQLEFATLAPGTFLEKLALAGSYAGQEEPQAGEVYERQAGQLELNARLKLRAGLLQNLLLGAQFQFSENRFDRASTDEQKAQLRAIVDGRAGDAFVRATVWAEAGWPDRGSSYGRIAAQAAFEKEFLVRHNQTIGVEALLGGAKEWSAPAYAEFYGGNSDRNFLYDNLDSTALTAFPNGPIVRSFGEGQALVRNRRGRGANGYWNLNLNVSLPLPWLSMPLIPDEEIAPGLSLKRLLKNKAGDSVSYYAVQLENEGMSPEAALAKAQAMYGEVRPAIEFIADRANVYALKPLLLFDLAGQESGHVQSAFGGGLQLTIVTAKMEVGYMETVTGGSSGNLFARIVFQNIF